MSNLGSIDRINLKVNLIYIYRGLFFFLNLFIMVKIDMEFLFDRFD